MSASVCETVARQSSVEVVVVGDVLDDAVRRDEGHGDVVEGGAGDVHNDGIEYGQRLPCPGGGGFLFAADGGSLEAGFVFVADDCFGRDAACA